MPPCHHFIPYLLTLNITAKDLGGFILVDTFSGSLSIPIEEIEDFLGRGAVSLLKKRLSSASIRWLTLRAPRLTSVRLFVYAACLRRDLQGLQCIAERDMERGGHPDVILYLV